MSVADTTSCVAQARSEIRVLLIEDDHQVAASLQRTLRREGIVVKWASTGAAAYACKADFRPTVALVDLQLPDMRGIDLIPWLAAGGRCGVIVVTGVDNEAERVISLELGADDYLVKPPSSRELIARVHAVCRRFRSTIRRSDTRTIDVGPFRIDLGGRIVVRADGSAIELTPKEFAVLETLALADAEPVSRDQLSDRVLNRRWHPEDRSVDQLVFGLRRELPVDQHGRSMIDSVRGLGYVLRIAPPSTSRAPSGGEFSHLVSEAAC